MERASRPARVGALSADDWLRAAAYALARDGPDAVRVEPLARALGVTKGSFYWHFRDLEALLAALPDWWRETGTDAVMRAVESRGGSARERFDFLLSVATAKPDRLEAAMRAWAQARPGVAQAVARVDAVRVAYVARLFEELGLTRTEARARAGFFYRALIGEWTLASARAERPDPAVWLVASRLLTRH